MIERETILSLEFYNYKGIFTGSLEQMRYRICKIEEEEEKTFEVCVWRGPYNYDVTPKEEMEVRTFDFSEDGKTELVDWLKAIYVEKYQYEGNV